MISRRPARPGRPKYTARSKRPGRRSAGSRSAARFVAPTTRMLELTGGFFLSWCSVGRNRLTRSIPQPRMRPPIVGSSNDCIWTSSSLTTPATPSRMSERAMPRPPSVSPLMRLTPPREPAIASNSSMKPIAPPSRRAILRIALKYERILRFVCP